MNFCKHKNALGIPGKGVHAYRVFNLAIVDVILTFLLGFVLHYAFFRGRWCIGWTFLGAFLSGIALHRLFCVQTTIDKILFPNALD